MVAVTIFWQVRLLESVGILYILFGFAIKISSSP